MDLDPRILSWIQEKFLEIVDLGSWIHRGVDMFSLEVRLEIVMLRLRVSRQMLYIVDDLLITNYPYMYAKCVVMYLYGSHTSFVNHKITISQM